MNGWTRRIVPVVFGSALLGMVSPAGADDAAMKALFVKSKCDSCHSVKSQGIEKKINPKTGKPRKGPDLSGAGLAHDAAFIGPWLKKEVEAESVYDKAKKVKHKKKFKGSDEDLKALSEWMAAQKTKVEVPEDAAGEDEADEKDE